MENNLPENKKGGVVSKQRIYQVASSHALEAIRVLVEVMQNGDSDSNKVGAAKTILSKCVPDLKATELSTDEQSKFIFQIIKDSTLENARDKDTTNNSKLQSSGNDLPKSSKV